jgi:hypothetical protein
MESCVTDGVCGSTSSRRRTDNFRESPRARSELSGRPPFIAAAAPAKGTPDKKRRLGVHAAEPGPPTRQPRWGGETR